MVGVIPKKSASGRKQWTIHGPQRGSLKRLRSQLASDGCPESQVVLARQLLDEECEYKAEQRENAKLGVYWLLKASEQGNLEATEMLKSCLKTGKGISEHNYMDVKACISMTQDDKIVRKAAKEVFASLSNGDEYITSNQLEKRILAIDRGESSSSKPAENGHSANETDGTIGEIMPNYDESTDSEEEIDWSEKSNGSNEKLTEDSLVSAAITFSHGQLPVINNMICLAQPNLRALDDIPFIYWSLLYPVLSTKILYFKLMKYLGNKSIPLPLVRNEIQLIVLFLIYSVVSTENIANFLPTVLFYCSFLVMIITTFQLLQTQRELHEFRLWRGLFICYSNGDLNEYSFETQFIFNHIKHYVWFFFSLLVHYFMYSINPIKLESEFTVMSCCFMFMTLFGFMPKRRSKTVIDSLVLLSFAINVLARYPYETDPIVSRGWRYLELVFPSFPSYVVGNGIEFCINFRLLLYAAIPVILGQMAMKENWRGSYKTVLPHLVTLSWLQYFALCSHNATTYGLFRATLAVVGSVLFLPLVGLTSVILPVAAVTQWIITSNVIHSICLFLFLLTICLAVCFMCAQTRYAKYTAAVQVILMLLAFFTLIKTSHYTSSLSNKFSNDVEYSSHSKSLDWNEFQKLCHQESLEGTETTANAQIRCAELAGAQIFWEGTVESVTLSSIQNSVENILSRFPKVFSSYLYCLFGAPQDSLCEQEKSSDCVASHQFSSSKCSLKEYNSYSFEIMIKMPSFYWRLSPEVYLHLDNQFKNFTLRTKAKDLVWFKGVLQNEATLGSNGILGAVGTHIKVEEIGCLVCSDIELTSTKHAESRIFTMDLLRKCFKVFKFILNVVFNPILTFK
ncbi:wolframin [Dendroctonus ponderosae]|uniref:Wolframin n=1 Tax=Dendroctonus ponderosae TaxID=77166 RepID=U4TXE6_DENPD|nr:wolframin [Dendroctonus ponderosae]ERL86279.1 hypothetical protein D910_03688 [Dendroctonus ponderosae]KAH1017488.1 hypothetical protein HUJ05_008119 [Dendroctonus ponderosae]